MDARSAPRDIEAAVAALGDGAFTEQALATHVAPLFAHALAIAPERVYLANHSLGRPLDAMDSDVREGLAAWYAKMGGAWDAWMTELDAYRGRLARLMNAPRSDCVVPKTSAGQGLRAILNSYRIDERPRIVATRGEFDSLDIILREYARCGRIDLAFVEARGDGRFETADIVDVIGTRVDLAVVSEVIFNTGQRIDRIDAIVDRTHRAHGRVLLDVYHSLGALPVDVTALDVDFAVGGSYKYLRGGPGACFLYLHPRHLDGSLRTLDTGWFAKRDAFSYGRPDPPQLAEGGDAFLESTPPVLTWYQARAGHRLTLALDPARIRAYSLRQQQRLVELLASRGIAARGGTGDHGAFVVVTDPRAGHWCAALAQRQIVTDARGDHLRMCPDILTKEEELVRATDALTDIA
ncbi:MAG: aminotransferase class V-fold PLP-dependent enzyme [Pseudomonadota bacterium]|nr:aminotransferase class V-fold PLP-dependent enzyme [Pseudomonadota bacterium]